MEPEALIAGLLYVQQIIAVLEWPALPFQCWRRVVFACLMIASKMWDDHSCSTRSFGRCSHGKLATTTLVEIERTILLLLDYRLFLTDTDYANTYYQLKGIWMNLQLDTEGNVLPHPVSLLPELSLPRNWHPCALFRMESPSIGTPVPNNPSYDSASGIGEFGIRSSDPTDNVHIPPSPVTVVSTPVREIVEQSELIVKRPEIVNGEKRGRHWREDKSELKPILYTYPTQSLSFGVHDAAGIGRHGETYDRVPTAEILYSTAHPTTQRIKQRQ
ncbi:hypothetical protein BLNAU_3628 [Blattamonas nauphoetae]|uniref:Cyclin N-terminal domain-containing protein n=1 Tax=Blattamonas nauphoetae TaxID=2049346 RepID=A0ABQ9YCW9_9EUKA|nr:hypothetical protein BLNAU_3628 [Blattamonas nauphoetae]